MILLAVATVAVGVACVYNPAVAAYIAKIIASIRSTARAAAAALVPIFPHIVKRLHNKLKGTIYEKLQIQERNS